MSPIIQSNSAKLVILWKTCLTKEPTSVALKCKTLWLEQVYFCLFLLFCFQKQTFSQTLGSNPGQPGQLFKVGSACCFFLDRCGTRRRILSCCFANTLEFVTQFPKHYTPGCFSAFLAASEQEDDVQSTATTSGFSHFRRSCWKDLVFVMRERKPVFHSWLMCLHFTHKGNIYIIIPDWRFRDE